MRGEFDGRRVGWSLAKESGSLLLQAAMFGFGFLPSRHRPVRRRDIHTTVFVHGLAASKSSLAPVAAYLAWHGHRRQFATRYCPGGSIEGLALQLKRQIDREVKGGRIDLVCHSMGGLVGRYYLQQLDGARRVDRFVTLATPHMGTHATAYLPTPLVRQMSPGSSFLEHLNSLEPPRGVQCTSISAGDDVIVLPPRAAALPFGTSLHVEGVGHTGLLLSPRVLAAVKRSLGPNQEGRRLLTGRLAG
jgi:triacylglycerol esterase/lipase EstA (alpha/beta hydrolase family)